jgi:hypothetical protein
MVNDPLSPGGGYERAEACQGLDLSYGHRPTPAAELTQESGCARSGLRKIHAKARFEVPSRMEAFFIDKPDVGAQQRLLFHTLLHRGADRSAEATKGGPIPRSISLVDQQARRRCA